MRILIVTVSEKCPAAYAVRTDGWHPEIVVVDPDDIYAYGKAMASFWADGEAFINIEHDMAPWQGAIQALRSCTLDLCLYGYYRAEQGSLGMIRFSEALIKKFPNINARWERTPWNMLESGVLGPLKNVQRHQHFPNVAHLSGWFV